MRNPGSEGVLYGAHCEEEGGLRHQNPPGSPSLPMTFKQEEMAREIAPLGGAIKQTSKRK